MSSPLPPPPFFGWSQIMNASKPVGHTRAETDEFWEFLLDVEDLTHDPDTGQP